MARPIGSCEECGKPCNRRKGKSGRKLCAECGISHGLTSVREMVDKSGPTWDRYLAGMSRYVEEEWDRRIDRELGELGPPV